MSTTTMNQNSISQNPTNEKQIWVTNMLLGGLSILVCIACWMFIDKSVSVMTVSQFAVTMAFIVNHPHFASSYMLLYSDFRKNITKSFKYLWAAVLAPALLLGYLAYCIIYQRADLLGHSINAMFFLVGWHYIKQIFGVVIVTSALRKFYYSNTERYIILLNLFSIWAISFFNSQTYIGSFDFYGIKYNSIGFDKVWLNLSYSVFISSFIYMVGMHVKKYIDTGLLPVSSAMVAMGALYVWYIPTFNHPHFGYLIPFFHSLQYLVFVWAFKKNQVNDQIKSQSGAEKRKQWVVKFAGYAAVSLILGALFFEFIPKGLDKSFAINNPGLGTSPILVAFLLFINIHHYFIDNVIWKSTNTEVKKHLFLH